jgi:hypothetical protein
MKVLNRSRRDRAAATFALLAVASLAVIAVESVLPFGSGLRSLTAIVALGAYTYFAGRAVRIWQGRGHPSLHRSAWRRHFLNETAALTSTTKWNGRQATSSVATHRPADARPRAG